MTRSRHRYVNREGTPMDTYHLDELIERFRHYQAAVGRAKGTQARYHYTFLLFGRFLDAEGLPRTSAVLTTAVMERFALWLRVTPAKPQHGTSKRSESGIHAHLRDLRAFCKWLLDQGLLAQPVRFPMPKIPKRLFRILSDDELQRVWQSQYLTGTGDLSIEEGVLSGRG